MLAKAVCLSLKSQGRSSSCKTPLPTQTLALTRKSPDILPNSSHSPCLTNGLYSTCSNLPGPYSFLALYPTSTPASSPPGCLQLPNTLLRRWASVLTTLSPPLLFLMRKMPLELRPLIPLPGFACSEDSKENWGACSCC